MAEFRKSWRYLIVVPLFFSQSLFLFQSGSLQDVLSPATRLPTAPQIIEAVQKSLDDLEILHGILSVNRFRPPAGKLSLADSLRLKINALKSELHHAVANGNEPNWNSLAMAVSEALNFFVEKGFQSGGVTVEMLDIQGDLLEQAIGDLSLQVKFLSQLMTEEQRVDQELWLESGLDSMSAVKHDLSGMIQAVCSNAELLKIRLTQNVENLELMLPLLFEKIERIRKLCGRWNNVSRIDPNEKTLFQLKAVVFQICKEAVILAGLADILQQRPYFKGGDLENRTSLSVIWEESRAVQAFADVFLHDQMLELREMSISEILNSVTQNAAKKFGQSVKITFTRKTEKYPKVLADRVAIQHAVLNLVKNSVVHGKPTYVRISLDEKNGKAVVVIENDIGVGGHFIPAAMLEKIPVPEKTKSVPRLFVDPYSTSGNVGIDHGIGTKIAWSLVEAIGGDMEVESNTKKTVFTISIPLKKNDGTPGNGSARIKIPRLSNTPPNGTKAGNGTPPNGVSLAESAV